SHDVPLWDDVWPLHARISRNSIFDDAALTKHYTAQCSSKVASKPITSKLLSVISCRSVFMTAPQRLTDRKREAIIQAAIAEFRAHGFDITSMDKIAATAGVSKRTVYNHFPSKEELFAEILN